MESIQKENIFKKLTNRKNLILFLATSIILLGIFWYFSNIVFSKNSQFESSFNLSELLSNENFAKQNGQFLSAIFLSIFNGANIKFLAFVQGLFFTLFCILLAINFGKRDSYQRTIILIISGILLFAIQYFIFFKLLSTFNVTAYCLFPIIVLLAFIMLLRKDNNKIYQVILFFVFVLLASFLNFIFSILVFEFLQVKVLLRVMQKTKVIDMVYDLVALFVSVLGIVYFLIFGNLSLSFANIPGNFSRLFDYSLLNSVSSRIVFVLALFAVLVNAFLIFRKKKNIFVIVSFSSLIIYAIFVCLFKKTSLLSIYTFLLLVITFIASSFTFLFEIKYPVNYINYLLCAVSMACSIAVIPGELNQFSRLMKNEYLINNLLSSNNTNYYLFDVDKNEEEHLRYYYNIDDSIHIKSLPEQKGELKVTDNFWTTCVLFGYYPKEGTSFWCQKETAFYFMAKDKVKLCFYNPFLEENVFDIIINGKVKEFIADPQSICKIEVETESGFSLFEYKSHTDYKVELPETRALNMLVDSIEIE